MLIKTMSLSLILFALVCVFITSLLSGIIGMAGDALMMLVVAFALPLPQGMALYAVALFFACVSRAWIHRKSLCKKSIEYYLVGLLFAFIFGALPALALDKSVQSALTALEYALLGLAPFIVFFSRGKSRPDFSQPPQALICAVAGESLRAVDSAALLLNLFFQNIALTRFEVISTKAAAQIIPNLARIIHTDFAAAFAGDMLWLCLAAAPLAVLGSGLGNKALKKISDERFYKITQILLWIIGAVYLWSASLVFMPAPASP
jgi:uncharacterized membrane protein YfcA